MEETVFLFPGQGAQKPGMARDLYERYGAARSVFEQASRAVGMDLARLCFEGNAAELKRTEVSQPAIFSASMAALRSLEEELGRDLEAAACAGLSLGEYGALVAAGALELADAARLLKARGHYMHEACRANPGAMYSIIGLEDEAVEQACRRVRDEGAGVWPANYNCPGQVVISGTEQATARAAELCTQMGARRALQLKVAGAFHSPLMEPAVEKLTSELKRARLREPAFPVVANVTGEPVQDPERIRELLAAQVTSPVRWTDSMRWCLRHEGHFFLELGPGRVLQGLLRRIDRQAECASSGTAGEVREVAARL